MIINTKKAGGITPSGSISITENDTYDVTEYAEAVVNVSGGTPTRTNKYRPPDYPDYDSLTNLPNQSMAFYTFDTQICDPADLICNIAWYDYSEGPNYRVQVDRGYISNGQFVANHTWSDLYFAIQQIGTFNDFDREIPTDEGRYVVYRVWVPSSVETPNRFISFLDVNSFINKNGDSRSSCLSPLVEVYYWKCGLSGAKVNGYYNSTIYTMLQTFKQCYVADGTRLYWSNTNRIPRYIEIDGALNSSFSWYYPFNGGSNIEHITLKNFTMNNTDSTGSAFNGCNRLSEIVFDNMTVKTVALNACFASCSALSKLTLDGWDVSSVTNASTCFSGCASLIDLDISGWDLSNVTSSSNMFKGCTSLKNVLCEDTNLPTVSFSLSDSSRLTDASLVNIANALPSAAATLTLHATPKGRLATIMGTVADGVFTADESGTVTLENFITQTKGWTVA